LTIRDFRFLGKVEIWVEADEFDCPAGYKLEMTKVES